MICYRFRRVFCLFLCFILLFSVHTTVLAAELFEEEGLTNDSTAFYWINHNSTYVSVSWLNLNIPSTGTAFTSAILNIGIGKWALGTTGFENEPRVNYTQPNLVNMPANGWIANSIPSQTFFDDLFPLDGQSTGKVAQSRIFSPSGRQIQDGDYDSTTIAYAEIFYNPTYVNSSNNNWISSIAHEIGHCLGFGHHSEASSIMNPRNSQQMSLTEYDQEEFQRKY